MLRPVQLGVFTLRACLASALLVRQLKGASAVQKAGRDRGKVSQFEHLERHLALGKEVDDYQILTSSVEMR
jgi:hypothetical protein